MEDKLNFLLEINKQILLNQQFIIEHLARLSKRTLPKICSSIEETILKDASVINTFNQNLIFEINKNLNTSNDD